MIFNTTKRNLCGVVQWEPRKKTPPTAKKAKEIDKPCWCSFEGAGTSATSSPAPGHTVRNQAELAGAGQWRCPGWQRHFRFPRPLGQYPRKQKFFSPWYREYNRGLKCPPPGSVRHRGGPRSRRAAPAVRGFLPPPPQREPRRKRKAPARTLGPKKEQVECFAVLWLLYSSGVEKGYRNRNPGDPFPKTGREKDPPNFGSTDTEEKAWHQARAQNPARPTPRPASRWETAPPTKRKLDPCR